MKVIFLDVDGVLNCIGKRHRTIERTPDGYIGIEQKKIGLLKQIVDATDAKIVVSSTWRLEEKSLGWLRDELQKQGLDFIDRTKELHHFRGLEIQEWLDRHPNTEAFVILDDDNDMCHLQANFVHTYYEDGLTLSGVKKAIGILNMVSVV